MLASEGNGAQLVEQVAPFVLPEQSVLQFNTGAPMFEPSQLEQQLDHVQNERMVMLQTLKRGLLEG